MADNICPNCGERNDPGAQFCFNCNTFLPWFDTQERQLPVTEPTPATPDPVPPATPDPAPPTTAPDAAARPNTPATPPPRPREGLTAGGIRAEIAPTAVELEADGEGVSTLVTVWNLSPIVEAYRIEAPDGPGWLRVEASEVRVYPGTNQEIPVTLRIVPGALAPAGTTTLPLRVQSVEHAEVAASVEVAITVAALDVPVILRPDPSVVRVRDTRTGRLQLTVDNSAGNRARTLRLSGRDPEGVTTFDFTPPVLEVPPGGTAVAAVTLRAAAPDPGQQVTRSLTVRAADERAAGNPVDTPVTFVQATSVDAPLAVRAEPALVRTTDADSAALETVLDNRKGTRTKRVFLTGRDPERAVRFTFAPPSLDVLPGEQVTARARLQAPPPGPGREVSRALTVVAAVEGSAEIEATATWVHATSAIPVEPPVTVKLEPSKVRAVDSPTAQLQVIVDNRRGTRPHRVTFTGADPERAVTFTIWPPTADVAPGQVARVNVRVDAPLPPPGAEYPRQITVVAVDGEQEIEASGTFLQVSSPPPPDEPLVVRLDPTVARVRNSGSATLTAVADNRGGGRHRQITFSGHDAEGVVRFSFVPPVVQVAAGQWAATSVRMAAPRPDGGEQVSRPITVIASDGERDAQASGSFVQESTDWRPWWRIILTVLGGLLMAGGSVLAWHVDTTFEVDPAFGAQVRPNVTGLEWSLPAIDSASEAVAPGVFFTDLPDAVDPLVSAGAVMIILAALVILGAFGPTGRLTRLASLVAAVLFAAFLVAVSLQAGTGRIGPGVFVVFGGCVLAFIGGLLARPRRSRG